MQVRVFLAGLAALSLGGCVSMARDPAGAVLGPDFAELTFRLGVEDTVGLGSATVQEYRIGASRDQAQARTARIFTWAHKDPRSLLLPVGQPVHAFAELRGYWGAPGITHNGSNTCLNISVFTPQPGARYDVMQVGEPTITCRLQIIDMATGAPPAGLEVITFPPDKPAAP
jgi:hypothetical protein